MNQPALRLKDLAKASGYILSLSNEIEDKYTKDIRQFLAEEKPFIQPVMGSIMHLGEAQLENFELP